jgi:PBP1b-binding outer membrane lipoprotein LpoB
MKKLLIVVCIAMVSVTACSDNSTKETTDSNKTTETKKVDSREQQIKDSTEMLDKKLADPNSNYSPDSLK